MRLCALAGALAALSVASTGRAQSPQDQGPPAGADDKKRLEDIQLPAGVEQRRQDVSQEISENPVDKAGPAMFNVKVGPAIGFSGLAATIAVQADLAYAVAKGNHEDVRSGDLYVMISPELQIGTGAAITLPVGVQYDIPTSIRGLYLYPRVLLGYSLVISGGTESAFVFAPAIGAKYVVRRNLNIGIEPAVLPIYIGSKNTIAQYRIFAYAGLNF